MMNASAPAPDIPVHDIGMEVAAISKSFGSTRALDDVSFAVRRGAIHALLGGNGSGKSTLIKILAGVLPAERGGRVVRRSGGDSVEHEITELHPALSRELGFRFVHQDSPVFPDLSVAENLALGSGYALGAMGNIDWRQQRDRAAKVLAQFEIDARPTDQVQRLAPAARTLLAIARALQDQDDPGQSVLVLDEPTATLPPAEVQWLLGSLRRLADQGLTILWVSHRLDEVCAAADDITVLRDGAHVITAPLDGRTTADLAELIVGHPVPRVGQSHIDDNAEVVLKVDDLAAGAISEVSLEVRQGEILGIVGITGSGRSSLLRGIYGALPRRSGTVRIDGAELRGGHVPSARAMGVRFLPEERKLIGFPDMTIAMNATGPDAGKFWRGLLDRRAERQAARRLIDRYKIRAESAEALLSSLSGGNQQKVLVGTAIDSRPSVLLIDEPTQGVDVGARADIHTLIKESIAGRGCAVIVSSDLEEIVDLCDRVLVVSGGHIVATLIGEQITEVGIARQMEKGAAPIAVPATDAITQGS